MSRTRLDEAHDFARKNGISLGYIGGFFPRMIDEARVSSDSAGFIRDATRMHKFLVDKDINAAPDAAEAMHGWWRGEGKEVQLNAPSALRDGMRNMGVLLRQRTLLDRKLRGQATPDPADVQRRDTLTQQIDALVNQHQDALGRWVGSNAAQNWHLRVTTGGLYDLDTKGPSTKFTAKRELPPEADQFMRDWYHNDPTEVLPRYFEQVARRGSYAELFGAKHEILQQLVDQAALGGMHTEDVHAIKRIVENVTGRTSYSNAPGLAKASNFIGALASIALLPRAAFTQLSEPMAGALGFGDMKFAYESFAKQIRNLWDTSGKEDRTAIVQHMGILNSAYHDSIINHRFIDYADSPQTAAFLSKFYKMTGLTYLTNAQKLAVSESGTAMLRRMLDRSLSGDTKQADAAQRTLRELGVNVDEGQHQRLADWLNGFDNMPSVPEFEAARDGINEVYAQALHRIVDRTIQDPTRAMKPMYSADPLGKMTYAFLSFNWAFQRNVLDAAMGRIHHAYEVGKDGSTGLKGVAKGVMAATPETMWTLHNAAALVAAATVAKTLHHAIFNQDQWDKHDQEGDLVPWLIESGASSSGVGGTLDPVAQVLSHLRYTSSVSSLVNGAPLSYMLENAQALLAPHVMGEDDPTSNTQTWKQAQAFYNLILEPAAMWGLIKTSQMFPGGLVAPLAGAAAWKLSSPDMKNWFATSLTGEKGATLPKPKGEDALPELPDIPELPSLTPKPGKEGEGGSGSLLGTIASGAADDVAVPALRVVPGWGKVLGGAGLLGYGAYGFWDRAATFNEQGVPPKPK